LISKKFIRNSIIYTIAGSLPLASGIILLPFYFRYLSPSVYGATALYTGVSMLVQILVTYSFDTSIYSYFHEFKNDRSKLSVYVSSSFTFILMLSVLIGVFLSIFGSIIFEKVFTESKILFYPYGLIAVATGIFQAIIKVNSSLLQTQEKASTFLWLNLLSFALIALFTVIGLYFFPDELIGPIGGRFAAVAITGVWVLITIYHQFDFHFDFRLLKSTLGFNHPSLLYQTMQWFNNYYDKVLMSTLGLSLPQIGIYDLATKCMMAIEFVLSGFYNSFFPKVLGIVALQTEKKTTIEINRYYNGLTAVTVLLVGLCIFFFPIIIEWFITKPGYHKAIPLIPFVAVTYLLRAIRYYVAMPYAAIRYQKPLPFFYLLIVTIKIGAMLFLIPVYGIMGVLIATWTGYCVEVVILYFGVKNKFIFKVNMFKTIIAPVSMALIIVVVEPWIGEERPLVTHAIYLVLGVALLVWAYRNELKVITWSKIIK
jgi:O-antigen/teichoic acid export membrane protein